MSDDILGLDAADFKNRDYSINNIILIARKKVLSCIMNI